MTKDKYTVTAALPYANGPLHLGHVAGVYLPSDIFVRFLMGLPMYWTKLEPHIKIYLKQRVMSFSLQNYQVNCTKIMLCALIRGVVWVGRAVVEESGSPAVQFHRQ